MSYEEEDACHAASIHPSMHACVCVCVCVCVCAPGDTQGRGRCSFFSARGALLKSPAFITASHFCGERGYSTRCHR
jgi:hypothetical protein